MPAPWVDSQSVWKRQVWVTRDELAALSRIPTGLNVFLVCLNWIALLGTLELALRLHSLAFDTLAYFAIGVLFVSIAYWDHEAAHYTFLPNRRWNDLLADLFLAGPLGMTVAQHRWQHSRHHSYLNEPEHEIDQTAWICLGGPHLLAEVLRHAVGWYAIVTVLRYRPASEDMPRRSVASVAGFILGNGAVFTLCALQGQWYLYFALWVFPLFSLSVALMNLGNIVYHQSSSEICEAGTARMPPITRLVRANFLERTIVTPTGFYFHVEHHQFPGIPAYRLSRLRRLLEGRGRFQQEDVIETRGFLRTAWRLSREPSFGTELMPKPDPRQSVAAG